MNDAQNSDAQNGAQKLAAPGLTVAERPSGRDALVTLAGELDHETVGILREALARTMRGYPRRLLLDCAGLAFCDSSGLNLLLHTRLAAAGTSIELVAPRRMLLRLLALTGTEELFPIHRSLAEAVPDGPGQTRRSGTERLSTDRR
jgi:anti-anti-sigma factor